MPASSVVLSLEAQAAVRPRLWIQHGADGELSRWIGSQCPHCRGAFNSRPRLARVFSVETAEPLSQGSLCRALLRGNVVTGHEERASEPVMPRNNPLPMPRMVCRGHDTLLNSTLPTTLPLRPALDVSQLHKNRLIVVPDINPPGKPPSSAQRHTQAYICREPNLANQARQLSHQGKDVATSRGAWTLDDSRINVLTWPRNGDLLTRPTEGHSVIPLLGPLSRRRYRSGPP